MFALELSSGAAVILRQAASLVLEWLHVLHKTQMTRTGAAAVAAVVQWQSGAVEKDLFAKYF